MWRPGQDHYWRPLYTLKCYNLHALTIVIITKYIYIFCGGPLVVEAPGQLPSLPPLKSGHVRCCATIVHEKFEKSGHCLGWYWQ